MTPIVEVQNLYKTYRLGRVDVPVLRGATMSLDEGETLAVLGASGSGKSTLLHLIGGLDRADRTQSAKCAKCGYELNGLKGTVCPECSEPIVGGAIRFRGKSLAHMSAGELNTYRGRHVGFVFQFYHLLPELNVLQNVLIGAMAGLGPLGYWRTRGQSVESAKQLLDAVGLAHRLNHRPAELSGGERQRVAIARGLVNRPDVLLADEPTGNLDRKTGRKILDLLDEIRQKTRQAMIIVTHDEETAGRADRVISLLDGRVRADNAASASPN
ncbi:MAG: ABC transporter ATP-binding protein [Phycisphaerales bacterium]|nr:ABC transporter ATP-binding protein [Phycisphaerales bacterium]